VIPALGLMVAVIGGVICLYILVRCAQVFEGNSSGGTRFLAAMTAVASLAAIFVIARLALDILVAGVDVSTELGTFGR
jgi:hypothetical protein